MTRWLQTLDPDHLEEERFSWKHEGWNLTFTPIARASKFRGSKGRVLGVFRGGEASWVDDSGALRRALEEKGRAYGVLDKPLVLAINALAMSPDDHDVINALYGTLQLTFEFDQPEAAKYVRAADGYWYDGGWAHDHVAGVLIGRGINIHSVVNVHPTIWVHPQRRHEPSVGVDAPWRVADPVDSEIQFREPKASLRQFFGLSSGSFTAPAFDYRDSD